MELFKYEIFETIVEDLRGKIEEINDNFEKRETLYSLRYQLIRRQEQLAETEKLPFNAEKRKELVVLLQHHKEMLESSMYELALLKESDFNSNGN